MRGIKEKYELHHGVRITDGAIVAAETLSHRYISDRFLPDKAIDLMDEAASRTRMEVESKPEAIESPDSRILKKLGRATCGERVCTYWLTPVVSVYSKKKKYLHIKLTR